MKRIAIMLMLAAALSGCNTLNERTETACVSDKESVRVEDGNQYRVYTDQGTYKVEDILLGPTRFNSADVYGGIQPGTCYEFEIVGIRNGFLSEFPNIVTYTEVAR